MESLSSWLKCQLTAFRLATTQSGDNMEEVFIWAAYKGQLLNQVWERMRRKWLRNYLRKEKFAAMQSELALSQLEYWY
jgi:hypothetical protein